MIYWLIESYRTFFSKYWIYSIEHLRNVFRTKERVSSSRRSFFLSPLLHLAASALIICLLLLITLWLQWYLHLLHLIIYWCKPKLPAVQSFPLVNLYRGQICRSIHYSTLNQMILIALVSRLIWCRSTNLRCIKLALLAMWICIVLLMFLH